MMDNSAELPTYPHPGDDEDHLSPITHSKGLDWPWTWAVWLLDAAARRPPGACALGLAVALLRLVRGDGTGVAGPLVARRRAGVALLVVLPAGAAGADGAPSRPYGRATAPCVSLRFPLPL